MPRFPPRRILVPLDFSRPSLAALETARLLAKRCALSADLLYVQSLPLGLMNGDEGEGLGTASLSEEMAQFRRWRADALREKAAGFPAGKARAHVAQGWPVDEILKAARRLRDGLIVMGTHGHTGAERVVFGSITEAVTRRASVPILTVHGPAPRRIARVLLACNMEPYSDQALRYALELARACGAEATALHVASADLETARILFRDHLRSVLGEKGARVKQKIAYGDPRSAVVEEAVEGKFDLIVLSAHHKPILTSFRLGSTAESVLRHSPIPVLAVPFKTRR